MSWLRNLQGQLTELANEVLSEATEEIADPESELQVAAKARSEAERQLASEKGKVELLENKCSTLEQNLLDMHTEMDIGRAKLENMIGLRDEELKRLRVELEQTRSQTDDWDNNWEADSNKAEDAAVKEKALNALSNVEKQVEAIRTQKDTEIAILMDQHHQMINDLRESYEDRIRSLEESLAPSTSQSNASVVEHEKNDYLAAKEQLENLTLEASENVQKHQEEVGKLEITVQELTDDNSKLTSKIDKLSEQLTGYESIKRQTAELTRAYNDLNTEYENYKESNGNVVVNNRDLVQRIDTLRANLIEYEERYELCKREHAETERQLVQLTEDFSQLRDAMDNPSFEGEMNRMKEALEVSRHEASAMKNEVEKFRDVVTEFETELDELRGMNKKLIEDNQRLCGSLKQFQEDGSLQEQYNVTVDSLKAESDMLRERNGLLEAESNALRNKAIILEEQLSLMKEKETVLTTEDVERIQFLEEKVTELERVRDVKAADEGDSLDSLTKQLREALAANSEKTDECERLRAEVEENLKEIQVRQGCVDDLIVQNNLLQVQYQQAAETIQETRQALAEKDKAILKVEQDLVHVNEDHEQVSQEIERLKAKLNDSQAADNAVDLAEIERIQEQHKGMLQDMVDQYESQLKTLEATVVAAQARVQVLEEETRKHSEGPDMVSAVTALEQQNEELRKVTMEKHNECLTYYNELQSVVGKVSQAEQNAGGLATRVQQLEDILEKEKREKTAAQKELAGLRGHMVHMEQVTTAEAVEAEKREMDLRAMIQELQHSNHSANEGASETTRQLEQDVASLTSRLEESERVVGEWRSQFQSSDRMRKEVTDALQSLQGVLREISTDHEKESATLQHANIKLQAEVNNFSKEVSELKSETERLKFEKTAVEDEVEAAQRQISGRQRIIEDLEVQIEDLKSSSRQSSDSYRIDDSMLRSLFLSYFTSAPDKKGDIAVLLANILQYPKEDVEKITNSVFPNGKGVKARSSGGALSLTEQFVRFLENESESSKTAPQLPVEKNAPGAFSQELPAQVRVPPSSLDEILH